MRLFNPADDSFDKLDEVGIAIRRVGDNQLHVGLLYKPDGGEVRICHLVTHRDFRDELPNADYRWLQIKLNPILRRLAVSACQIVVARKESYPYGFKYDGAYFAPTTFEFFKQPLGQGLTCATFILAVFRNLSVELLDTPTWRSRDDDAIWQMHMIAALKEKFPAYPDHEAIKEVGDVRFRPEEVAAGGVSALPPLTFEAARPIAERIKRDLVRSYAA